MKDKVILHGNTNTKEMFYFGYFFFEFDELRFVSDFLYLGDASKMLVYGQKLETLIVTPCI
jgi:hypothetical protein